MRDRPAGPLKAVGNSAISADGCAGVVMFPVVGVNTVDPMVPFSVPRASLPPGVSMKTTVLPSRLRSAAAAGAATKDSAKL